MQATAFALGIHEDTGLAHLFVDDPARRRGAGRLHARGLPTRSCWRATCAGRCSPSSASCCGGSTRRASSARSPGCGWSPPRPSAEQLRRGRLDAGRRASATSPTGTCCCCRSRWRAGCSWSGEAAPPRSRSTAALEPLGGGGHAQAASGDRARGGSRRGARARARGGRAGRQAAAAGGRRDVAPGARGLERGRHLGRAGRVPAPRPERHPGLRRRRADRRRRAGGPRPRRAPRPQPRAGEGRDERRRAGGRAGRRRSASCATCSPAAAPSAWSWCRTARTGPRTQVAADAAEGVVTGGDVLRALHEPLALEQPAPQRRGDARRCARGSARSSAFSEILPAGPGGRRRLRRRLPGRRRRSRRAARRAEPRPRPDGRGRRDRVRARARRRSSACAAIRTRSSRPRS